MRPSKNLENKIPSGTYRRGQLVCMKVQFNSSLEPPLNHGQDAFGKSRLVITSITILGVTEMLFSFRLVLEGKTGKETTESLRLRVFKSFYKSF